MRLPTILIIDDDKPILDNFSGFFKGQGWAVTKASRAKKALKILKERNWACDCIILDQKMPGMTGLEFLKTLRERELHAPQIPVIVLSAYVDKHSEAERGFREYGATRIFTKPQEPDLLEVVARALACPAGFGSPEKQVEHDISVHELDQRVQHNEDLIAKHYRDKIEQPNPALRRISEPLLIVARRWNSWYPSFFDIPGGAYAVVFPAFRDTSRKRNIVHNRVAVIDPGFRFLRILSEDIGLSVSDMESCIVTHNHPDHIGGVFEYIACRHEAGLPTTFHCNASTRKMLAEIAGPKITPQQLPDNNKQEIVLNPYCDTNGTYRSLGVRAFATDHREAGWDSDPRGLILDCHAGPEKEKQEASARTVILGDSAFDQGNPTMDFASVLTETEPKIAVLHIGSAQLKQRVGGHLYLKGLARLVQELAAKLERLRRRPDNKLVVLISEWGLEHATAEQMKQICPELEGMDNASPITATVDLLRKGLEDIDHDKMIILPADIGLIVGMETGMVYIKDARGRTRGLPAEQVKFQAGPGGLIYS